MHLDARTLTFVLAISCIVMAAALWWVAGLRKEKGVGYWIASLLMKGWAISILAIGDVLPSTYLIGVRAGLLSLSYGLCYYALCEFFAIRRRHVLLVAPILLVVALVTAMPHQPIHAIALVDLVRGLQNVLPIWVILQYCEQRKARPQTLMIFGLVIIAAFFLLRGLSALADPESFVSLSSYRPVQSATWLATFAGTIVTSFAFVLMYQQRAARMLEQSNIELDQSARTDGLTGLHNRRHFDEAFQRAWNSAKRSGTPVSLVLLDIDHFKKLNDTFGHPAGDACLAAVAKKIGESVKRPGDLAARFGGEEFAVLLPATDLEGARRVAEGIRREVAALEVGFNGVALGKVTISAGLASIAPKEYLNPAHLIAAADAALYESKKQGRNRVTAGSAEPPP